MKQLVRQIPSVLIGLCFFVPVCCVVAAVFGYSFVLWDDFQFVIGLTAVSVLSAVLLIVRKQRLNKIQSVCFSVLPLVLFAVGARAFLNNQKLLSMGLAVVCILCTTPITVLCSNSKACKRTSTILTVLVILSVYCSLFMLLMMTIGEMTVVQSVVSPDNKYVAEVVDSDQGALGGDTLVRVKEIGKDVNLLAVQFIKTAQNIYWGEWGEFNTMEIHWKDENTLVINDKAYPIN